MKANANGTSVKRAADFAETGEYVVTLAGGEAVECLEKTLGKAA